MPRLTVPSPVGPLTLTEADGHLVSLDWCGPAGRDETPLLAEARRQLDAYFARRLKVFDLPLSLAGTPFRQRVWAAMRDIPYGATRSYGEIATALGSAPRAVGGACGKNPIAIIVPCHRILASGHRLGGYSGGLGAGTKRHLLALEEAAIASAA
ncbi:MAG: methylated-DNA--[protein]-cysteine S-methyltransferase [Alphaproteobacteria bacterium]|nr:methylated-DNA--[protein]-cysteine S-methyltransferase [Alphaproteobacteria bacterium]